MKKKITTFSSISPSFFIYQNNIEKLIHGNDIHQFFNLKNHNTFKQEFENFLLKNNPVFFQELLQYDSLENNTFLHILFKKSDWLKNVKNFNEEAINSTALNNNFYFMLYQFFINTCKNKIDKPDLNGNHCIHLLLKNEYIANDSKLFLCQKIPFPYNIFAEDLDRVVIVDYLWTIQKQQTEKTPFLEYIIKDNFYQLINTYTHNLLNATTSNNEKTEQILKFLEKIDIKNIYKEPNSYKELEKNYLKLLQKNQKLIFKKAIL